MRPPSDSPRRRLGRIAEGLALNFLEARGVMVIDRNVEVSGGEIDLLATDGGVRVAVEVRSVSAPGAAVDAFDRAKADRVWNLARSLQPPCSRVDLVAVRFGERFVEIHWIPSIG